MKSKSMNRNPIKKDRSFFQFETLQETDDPQNYEEYYLNGKYAKTSKGREKYALKKGNEYYFQTDDGPVYATRSKGNQILPYFAKGENGQPIVADNNGVPVYLFLDENTPIVPRKNQKEVYAKMDDDEVYPQNKDEKQFYAKDKCPAKKEGDKKYYAREKNAENQTVEYPPRKQTGDVFYIREDDSKLKYLFNIDLNRPVFPVKNGEEVQFSLNDAEYYPTDEEKKAYQAKDAGHSENLTKREGKECYAEDGKGNEIYPTRSSGSEYYQIDSNIEIAKNSEIDHFYASRK